jgi:hypothetical protein
VKRLTSLLNHAESFSFLTVTLKSLKKKRKKKKEGQGGAGVLPTYISIDDKASISIIKK